MKKQLILLIASVFLVSCNQAKQEDDINVDNLRASLAENKAINEKIDRQKNNNDFFASKEYQDSKEEGKCIDESDGDFSTLTNCVNQANDVIKNKIKQKVSALNNSKYTDKFLNAEYKKIQDKCYKEFIKSKDDISNENDLLIVQCVQEKIYQFGRNLK